MNPEDIRQVKEQIEKIRFGILKTYSGHIWSAPISFMIETVKLSEDGYLWCTSSYFPVSDSMRARGFRVRLKFIQKSQGLFIKLVGRAVIRDKQFLNKYIANAKPTGDAEERLLLKIRIEEVYGFEKRITSPYTSFFQSISNFTFNKAFIGRSV